MALSRSAIKRAVERFLIRIGGDRIGVRVKGRRGVILTYHNIVPSSLLPVGDRSLHLPLDVFERHLDHLDRVGEVVPLEDLLLAAASREEEGLRIAITFDDAYRGAVSLGVGALQERRLPATIFVVPSLLGDQTFWWDSLAEAVGAPQFATVRDRVLQDGRGTLDDAQVAASELGVELGAMPEICRSAFEGELQEAVKAPGIRVGSHSWSHPSLVRLSRSDLEMEVSRSREWLRSAFERSYLDVLSYPYGFHSAPVRQVALGAGHRAGLALHPGSLTARHHEDRPNGLFQVPRLNVPGALSAEGLCLRTVWL